MFTCAELPVGVSLDEALEQEEVELPVLRGALVDRLLDEPGKGGEGEKTKSTANTLLMNAKRRLRAIKKFHTKPVPSNSFLKYRLRAYFANFDKEQ